MPHYNVQAFSHLSSNLMTISFKFWHEVPNQKFIFQMTSGDIWPFLTHFLLRNYPIEQIGLPENRRFLMHTFLSRKFYYLFFNGWKKSPTFVNLKFVSRSFIQWTDCTFQNKTNYFFFFIVNLMLVCCNENFGLKLMSFVNSNLYSSRWPFELLYYHVSKCI